MYYTRRFISKSSAILFLLVGRAIALVSEETPRGEAARGARDDPIDKVLEQVPPPLLRLMTAESRRGKSTPN